MSDSFCDKLINDGIDIVFLINTTELNFNLYHKYSENISSKIYFSIANLVKSQKIDYYANEDVYVFKENLNKVLSKSDSNSISLQELKKHYTNKENFFDKNIQNNLDQLLNHVKLELKKMNYIYLI